MSIVCLIIRAYQGFLADFRNGDAFSTAIIVLKFISFIVFSIRILMGMVTIDYADDQLNTTQDSSDKASLYSNQERNYTIQQEKPKLLYQAEQSN